MRRRGGEPDTVPPWLGQVMKQVTPKRRKGVCIKCGHYIGRGIYVHEKNCNGDTQRTG